MNRSMTADIREWEDKERHLDIDLFEEEQSDVTVALLRDGTLTEYDCAVPKHSEMDKYLSSNERMACRGSGVIHSVNGSLETDDNNIYRFYTTNR